MEVRVKKILFVFFIFLFLISCSKTKNHQKPKIVKKKVSEIVKYLNITGSGQGFALKNGDFLFLSREKGDVSQLFRQKNGEIKKLTHFKESIRSYEVSPDESKLLFLTSKGGNEQFDIWLLNLDTNKVSAVLKDSSIRFDNPKWIDNNSFAFISNEFSKKDFFIYKFDLKTAKKSLLVDKKGYNFISFANKEVFLFTKYKGNHISVAYSFNFKTKKIRKIKGLKKNRYYEPISVFKKKGILMLTNEESDNNYLAFFKKGKKAIVFKDNFSVESVIADNKAKKIVFCINKEGFSDCFLNFKEKNIPLNLGKGKITLSMVRGNFLVFTLNSPNKIIQPALFYLKTNKIVNFFGYTNSNGIDVKNFVMPKLIKVKSFDNLEIPAFLYLPKNKKPPFKAIVYFHGGPASQFRPYFIRSFQYFLKEGFLIVAPNVRGSSGYGLKFMNADNYKKRMDSVKDGGAVLNYLKQKGLVKSGNFVAMGGSYGGFMVVSAMEQYPKEYKCGIDSVGVVDFVNFLKNTKAYRRKLREVEYGPLSDLEFLKQISPANHTEKIEGKLLIAHGENDPRVPVSDAYILFKNMKKNKKDVEILTFPDEGHGFRKKKNIEKYYQKIDSFLKECFSVRGENEQK